MIYLENPEYNRCLYYIKVYPQVKIGKKTYILIYFNIPKIIRTIFFE